MRAESRRISVATMRSGAESKAWPGEYPWFIELAGLEDLIAFLNANGGGLGLFTPEDDEECPMIEIFDDDQDED